MRCGRARFALTRLHGGASAFERWSSAAPAVTNIVIAPRSPPRLTRSLSRFRRLECDSSAARLRQPDRNRLLRQTRAVFALADVMHFLAHEFAGLRRWRFARA